MKRGKKAQGLKPLSSKISLMLSKSDKSSKTAAKTIILLTLLTLLSFFFLSLAKAPSWVLTNTQSEFNEGNYTNVSFNSSGVVKFIQGELPNSQADEEGANMSKNLLLMHLNNDSAYGEQTEGSNNVTYDFSGSGNNGTLYGPTWTSSGKFGGAFTFDGSDDYIETNAHINLTNGGTITAWIKVDSDSDTGTYDQHMIVEKEDSGWQGYQFFHYQPLRLGVVVSSARVYTPDNVISLSTWHFVAAVFDVTNQNIFIYVDGTQYNITPASAWSITQSDYTVNIGRWNRYHPNEDTFFDGTIDEVAIWNRSLSADEILQHYLRTNATHGTYESKVYDANRTVSWENMSWTQGVPYQEELPHDQTDEKDAGIVGGANMSGNVLLMHFNNDSAYGENNTRAYDFSGNGNNGTAVDNAAPTSAGKFNGAFTFDGSGDYIDCGNDSSLDITGEITISVWVFAKDTSINPILEKSNAYSTGEGYNIYYYNNGNTYVNIESGQHLLGCAGLIHTNTWDHLAFTFNGSHAVLYQNGIEKCSSDVAYNLDPSTDPLTIGTYARTVPNDYFNGLIDEVAIWNRTLSAAEILEHYKRSALNLTFQVRSDGDNASWPDYIGPDNTSSSYFTNASLANLSLTNLSNARYFQYKAYFDTNNTAYTPELWNVTGGYEDETAPTINISSPSNTTYTTASIDLNWTYDEILDWCAYSLNGGANDTSIGPTKWWSNTAIVSDLGDVGRYNRPTVFNMNGTWYLIAGEEYNGFFGYNWTGSTWQYDSNINSSLGDIGNYPQPEVFNISGTWYLIAGAGDGKFYGFNWTGSAWQADSNINSSLGDVGEFSRPAVFSMSNTLYLIAGESSGVFNGYNWTGSTWQSDTAIVSGLVDVGDYSAPTVFNMGGTWYLISGEYDGVFNGYNWTGSTWQSDSNIASGLVDVGDHSTPEVFNMSGTWYLVAGEKDGVFNGYDWGLKGANTTITAQQGGNNITIWANDSAGNMGQSSYVYFSVDSIYPTVDLDLPDNTTYSTNESLALNYSVYDVNQDSCWYNIDSGSNTSLASCANTTFNVSGPGGYTLTLYANDTFGNENSSSVVFTVDLTPTSTLISPENASWSDSTATFTCNGSDSTALSGITLYIWNSTAIYSTNATSANGVSAQASWNYTLPENNYTWNCLANDTQNNEDWDTNRTLYVDTTNPQINFTSPTEASGDYVKTNYTYVNVTVSDANNVSSFINWNYSLVGYWNFNNVVGGVVYDNSTYGNNGTMSGFTSNTTTTGKFGSALEFDGTDDHVDVGDPADGSLDFGTGDFTISAWIKKDQTGRYDVFLSKDKYAQGGDSSWRGYAFEFSTSTNNLYFLTGQGTANTLVSSQTAFEANKWYYIVGVRRSGYLYIYVNGEDDQPTPVASTHNVDNDWDFMIGRHPDATYPRHFDGKIDEVRIWNRALSAEEINASYNTGLYSLYHNFTGLADGNYSYYAQTIDLAGNMNQTEIRNLIIDTTAPNVSLISPANDTYTSDTSPNLTANITDNLGIKNATLHVYNETDSINETTTSFSEGTVERLLGIVYNFLYDGVFKWFYSAYDWAGNLFSAGNYTLTIDTTNPLISVTFPANNSNLSQTWINITGTASDTNNDTVYVNDTRFGDNTGTYASWNFTNTTIADGTYSINITANDSASKTNSTIIIFTIDATAPNITNMSISPSAAADIDPNVNINVTVNVTDVTTSVDTIVLRYWNYSTNVSTSSNVTMSSAGGDLFNASFNASVNGTWYYQVWANDSAGNNINNTPNSTDVQYECTWEISDTISDPTLGAFETTDVIGNITINNTGDASYPIHSCTLSFILTDNLATGRISYSPSDAVIGLAAKDTSTVNITATFLNKVVSEGLVITITDYGRKSATYQTTSNATLTSYAGGPYLNVVINSSPSAVNQTAALNFTLSVYVQNIGNESASNVTLNWTLPTGWGNASGILSVNVSTLNCSDPTISPSIGCDTNASLNTLVNLITATVSDPNTASIGTVTMLANSSSESKVNSSCTANCSYVSGSDSATATVSCYAVSDGVCPTSGTCSYDSTANNYDPDCTAPAAETITTGGGGGAGAAPAAIVAEAIYELVRGKDEDFSLEVKNPFKDASLRDIKMKVTGFLAPYITIEPAVLDKIEPNSTFNFTIRITAPAYFTVGKHDLTFTISSTKQVGVTETARTEKRYVTLAIHDVGRGDAAQLVSDSEDAIAEMMQLGLNVKKVQQLLSELQDEFEKSKYENVKELSQKVSTIKQNALSSQDTIESLQEKIKDAEGKGIKAEDTKILLNLAIAAFERGDYALALERAKDAEMTYAVETKGEFNLLYFVANNTIECLVGIIILTFLSALLFLKVKLSITNHSITSLYSEQDILLGLMKTVQHECFIEKKMSMGEYRQSMLEYEDRFSKAVQHALKLESIKANLFKLKKKGLEMERQGILKLMKELQSKYIKEGKVETRVYDQKMQSFTARLSEIEEQIALNEAKRALHRAKRKRFLRRFGLARPKATERLARKKKQTEHKRMKLKEKIKRRFESVIKKATEKKEKELDRKRKEQIERAKEEAPKQRKKEKLREKIRKRFERVVEREEKKRAKSRKK